MALIISDGHLIEVPDDTLPPPSAPIVVIPQAIPTVTAAQAKVALFRRGLYDTVITAVLAMPFDIQLWFQEARVWERTNAYVAGLSIELGLSDEQLDELFEYASTLSQ